MRCFPLIVLTAALILLPAAAYASPITLTTVLSGANENPVVISPGTGTATVIVDPTAHTIQINVTFSGLTSNAQAAHIHCCASPPTNAGVATTVPAFPGFPLGGTSGNYSSAVLSLQDPTTYNQTAVNGFLALNCGGSTSVVCPQAEATFVAGLLNGQTYLNIHTSMFPGGEIRGQLSPVPEPSSMVLLGSGLVGFIVMRRRKLGAQRS